MRRTSLLTGLLVALAAASGAVAEPVGAEGFRVEIRHLTGTRLSGLTESGSDLLVTDLASGRLIRLRRGRDPSPFGPSLPFGTDVIGDPSGPYKIAVRGDDLIVAQGWAAVDAAKSSFDHALLAIKPDGVVEVLSNDFWNPFEFLLVEDSIYVIDAGRNSLELLTADGRRTTLRSFPRLEYASARLSELSPTEFTDRQTYEVDAVPTGLARLDGRLFVSLFSGFPYLEAGGAVVSFNADSPTQAIRLEVGQMNMPVDIAFDGAGRLLVVEHGRFSQDAGFESGTGRLLEIDLETGERRDVVTGLTRPVSVLIRASGEIVVTELDGSLVTVSPEK